MKKYIVAAMVAVMALAMSAFAASLNVDGGTLQAGSDMDLTCAETATVSYDTGYQGAPGEPALRQGVNGVTVTFDGDCNGQYATVNLLRKKTSDAENIGALRLAAGTAEIENDKVSFSAIPGLAIADVEQVDVVVTSDGDTSFRRGVFN